MKNIDSGLDEMKKDMDSLEIPEELETRLRQGLDTAPLKKKKPNYRRFIGIAALIIFFLGYNADVLAYYGKKIIGYDGVMSGTLQELNEVGQGQIVDKTYTFSNGISVTLDAIMLDVNNLVLFHTVYNPQGFSEDRGVGFFRLEGLFNGYGGGGQGQISEDKKEIKWVTTYDSPKFFEKKMTMVLDSIVEGETGKIRFSLDRNQAMTEKLEVPINQEIEVGNRILTVDFIVASPISTTITGKIRDKENEKYSGETIQMENLELTLLVDNKSMSTETSSISSSEKSSEFTMTYDTLPKETNEIEIQLNELSVNQFVNERIQLSKDEVDKKVNVSGHVVIINEVYEREGATYIKVSTKEETSFNRLYLDIDGKNINLDLSEVDFGEYTEDNLKEAYRTRVLKFNGTGEEVHLVIEQIKGLELFDQIIFSEKIK